MRLWVCAHTCMIHPRNFLELCGRLDYVPGILIASLIEVPAIAGQLTLQKHDDRVMVDAKDVTVEQILAEWARVGQTSTRDRPCSKLPSPAADSSGNPK